MLEFYILDSPLETYLVKSEFLSGFFLLKLRAMNPEESWVKMVDMKITVEFSQIIGIFTAVCVLQVLRKSLSSRGLLY